MGDNRGTHYQFNNDEDEFADGQEQWDEGEEEFDERVSHASSRVHGSTYVPGRGSRHEMQQQQNAGYGREE